jgi:hypothetical protein
MFGFQGHSKSRQLNTPSPDVFPQVLRGLGLTIRVALGNAKKYLLSPAIAHEAAMLSPKEATVSIHQLRRNSNLGG